MSQSMNRPYSVIIGMSGLEGYAVDAAVTRWGMAFDAAVRGAGSEAKTRSEAERKVQTVIRKWVPSTREYR